MNNIHWNCIRRLNPKNISFLLCPKNSIFTKNGSQFQFCNNFEIFISTPIHPEYKILFFENFQYKLLPNRLWGVFLTFLIRKFARKILERRFRPSSFQNCLVKAPKFSAALAGYNCILDFFLKNIHFSNADQMPVYGFFNITRTGSKFVIEVRPPHDFHGRTKFFLPLSMNRGNEQRSLIKRSNDILIINVIYIDDQNIV